jgi:hypothetical protein
MSPISKSDLDAITNTIALAMQQGFSQLTAALSQPRAVPAQTKTTTYRLSGFLPKGSKADPADLQSKDQRILNAFLRKGFKNVVLLDRADPSKPFNVKPFKAWLDQGRVVRRGQKSFHGLFHIDQTDALPSSKPTKGKAKPQLVKS